MTDSFETRKASLDRKWQPLTDEHARQLSRAEESLTEFADGSPVDPLAIVAAYRSGKTQLLYHLFTTAWDRGIPAFYIGDPGALLAEFAATPEPDLNDWIQSKIDAQLTAYIQNNPSEVEWFPNVDTKQRQEFITNHGGDINSDQTVRTALLFDEVEQSYQEFIRVLDKDDSNPLRKINDGLQDSIKVWSFGMISAFEFIGEADWGRMREIRIPPLEVGDVRNRLAAKRPDATDLANVIWWLSRGRTGLIIKLIDGLPTDIEADSIDWFRDLARASFRETQLVNNRWTELPREDWEQAIQALLFRETGLDAWQVQDQTALSVKSCREITLNILKDEFLFDQTEVHQDALEILDRNVKRVWSGLAVPHQGSDSEMGLFPTSGLADKEQADAFLSLVSDTVVSFEPANVARSEAIGALDTAAGKFHTNWKKWAPDADIKEVPIETTAPVVVHSSFPPIAVNPERISSRTTEELDAAMDAGLIVQTEDAAAETVSVVFCPTADSFNTEYTAVIDEYDITAPTVLVVPEGREFDTTIGPTEVYTRHELLAIDSHRSNRFWTFIRQLFGRLKDEGFSDPNYINQKKKNKLLETCEEREIRNAIETLYDQLQQVAIEKGATLKDAYLESYSLPESETLLWQEERLSGVKPYWSSGKFVESTIALSYLLVLAPEYEADREYANLYASLKTGIEEGLIDSSKFQFKSYLENLFTQTGYSNAVNAERDHYEVQGELAPQVRQTQAALAELATLYGASTIIEKLDDPDVDLKDGHVPVASIDGLTHLGYGLTRALLIAGLTTGENAEIDLVDRLLQTGQRICSELETVNECQARVAEFNNRFEPPQTADIGMWIEIDTSRLDQYENNLEQIHVEVEDLIGKINADPSMGLLAYQYWFLLRLYLDDISQQITEMKANIPPSELGDIMEAVDLFDHVYEIIEQRKFVNAVFADQEEILSQLEYYGDEIFDLPAHLERSGAILSVVGDDALLSQVGEYDEPVYQEPTADEVMKLSMPEDNEALRALNRDIIVHKQNLKSLRGDLETIESKYNMLDDMLVTTRKELLNLLSAAEPREETHG